MIRKMNIIVTGANGLIGYELCKLLSSSHNVFAISRSNPNIIGVEFIKLNFNKEIDFDKFPKSIDVIYHLLQSEKFRNFPDSAIELYTVNTLSTLRLLEYARKKGCIKFVYASSGGVYGNSESAFSEESPVLNNQDLGFYIGSKLCSEIMTDNYKSYFDIIITRFFFVYGKRQNKTMLIPRLVDNIKNGKEITLQGEGGLIINPIHVNDASRVLMKILELNGIHKFNIGGEQVLSLKQISDIIGFKLGESPNYLYKEGNPTNLIGDIAKMKSLLTSPEIIFEKGIEELL